MLPLAIETPKWSSLEIDNIFHTSSNSHEKIIDVSSKAFHKPAFTRFYDLLTMECEVKKVICTPENLSKQELDLILAQVNSNTKKGLKITDSFNRPLGAVYTDWTKYNEDKKDAYLLGMRETAKVALEHLEETIDPLIYDFGAGTGQDAIPMLQLGHRVIAIDGDDEALQILKSNISQSERLLLRCVTSPFMSYEVTEPADLMISSYTLPYRPPADFTACMEKVTSSIKMGGILAAHFFGKPEIIDPSMTYHDVNELLTMLEKDYEILFFKVDPKDAPKTLFGCLDERSAAPFGELFHVVAKKLAKQ